MQLVFDCIKSTVSMMENDLYDQLSLEDQYLSCTEGIQCKSYLMSLIVVKLLSCDAIPFLFIVFVCFV